MSPDLLLNDLALYSLQIGLLIGLAAFVPGALRLRLPAAKLAYWQALLIACLALPLVAPWKQPVTAITLPGAAVAIQGGVLGEAPAAPRFTQAEIAFAILAAGIIVRLVWLAIGFLRLRRYRRHSKRLEASGWSAPLAWGVEADLRVSEDIASPVTFGLFRPIVLLPANFHELAPSAQEAILAHECVHVRRKDWLLTLSEEIVRALFWFHPAIWWLLGEIDLAREQAVDRRAVEITKGREEYVDALLAVAGARPALDLAPAPPFLRKRRLKHRVVAVLKGAGMSKGRAASALVAALCLMVAACWIAAGAFPLVAAPKPIPAGVAAPQARPAPDAPASIPNATTPVPQPQNSADTRPQLGERRVQPAVPIPRPSEAQPATAASPEGPGGVLRPIDDQPVESPVKSQRAIQRIRVGGNVQMANVTRKVSPAYPALARQARIQDDVILHVVIGTDGGIRDVRVVSGHPLLRQAALDAVRQWQYNPTLLNGEPVEVETDVDVNFVLNE